MTRVSLLPQHFLPTSKMIPGWLQEEIFGPVLIAQKFHTEEEAIEIANGTKYGLAAAVWTSDVNRAIRVAKAMEAGTVWVNSYRKTYHQAEFGGYKESGAGRTTGIEGMLECTQLKHINFDLVACHRQTSAPEDLWKLRRSSQPLGPGIAVAEEAAKVYNHAVTGGVHPEASKRCWFPDGQKIGTSVGESA